MKLEEFKNRCMAEAAAAGLTDYEVYYEVASESSVSAFRHEIKEVSSSTEGGVSFRCKIDGRMGYASTQSFDPENAAELVEKAIENARALETSEEEFLGEAGHEYKELPVTEVRTPGIEEMKAAVLAGQEALYASDPRVIDGCESNASVVELELGLANSKGLNLSSSNSGFIYYAVSVEIYHLEVPNPVQPILYF